MDPEDCSLEQHTRQRISIGVARRWKLDGSSGSRR
uniref:Uncharacterized protein n=1 Tax=Arundo donax TaxID=35708 RepID=A0A0A9SV26_ARUDO